LENNINALAIGMETKDTSLITLSLLSNGFLYLSVKKFTEALKNQQAALRIFIATHDSVGIATVYNDMGVDNMMEGNVDEALRNHSIALMIRKQINDYIGVGNSCSYISEILQQQRKYQQALANSIEALKYAKLSGNAGYALDSYNDAGSIYLEMHDDENALKTMIQYCR